MAADGRELHVPQQLREVLGRQAVVPHAFRVEAVGLEFFIAHRGDALQRALDVARQGRSHRVELEAHLVAGPRLRDRKHERGRRERASLLKEGSAGSHAFLYLVVDVDDVPPFRPVSVVVTTSDPGASSESTCFISTVAGRPSSGRLTR